MGVIKVLQDGAHVDDRPVPDRCPRTSARAWAPRCCGRSSAEARHSGALLRLSVLKQNPAARLYARLGFRTLAESPQSYKMTFIDTVDEL